MRTEAGFSAESTIDKTSNAGPLGVNAIQLTKRQMCSVDPGPDPGPPVLGVEGTVSGGRARAGDAVLLLILILLLFLFLILILILLFLFRVSGGRGGLRLR